MNNDEPKRDGLKAIDRRRAMVDRISETIGHGQNTIDYRLETEDYRPEALVRVLEAEGGLVVPVGDDAALAEAMHVLSEDVAMREKMGARNLAFVREFYTWNKSAGKLNNLYSEVLDNHQPSKKR
jgi:glycosyltransferase involved in cell wall biosynthesis